MKVKLTSVWIEVAVESNDWVEISIKESYLSFNLSSRLDQTWRLSQMLISDQNESIWGEQWRTHRSELPKICVRVDSVEDAVVAIWEEMVETMNSLDLMRLAAVMPL